MNQEGHTIRFVDISRYKHNYVGFCENFIYPMSINKERTTTTQGAHARVVRIRREIKEKKLVKISEREEREN